jgi:hypothetical protein
MSVSTEVVIYRTSLEVLLLKIKAELFMWDLFKAASRLTSTVIQSQVLLTPATSFETGRRFLFIGQAYLLSVGDKMYSLWT